MLNAQALRDRDMTTAPALETRLREKYDAFRRELAARLEDGLVIAFSGGVDSAFLLWAAEQERRRSGGRLLALTALSASMARTERADAERFARNLGVEHRWQESDEVSDPRYAANDGARCYYCKSELFRICRRVAAEAGYRWLAYGYNVSDGADVRPGHKAALEYEVLSPLADAGLEKKDVRMLMSAHGLELSEKPSSPCLSSRLMTGVRVTPAKLADVEAFEQILRQAGLNVVRARLHEVGSSRFVRIETAPEEMARALEQRELLQHEARARGYRWVLLDLAGYRLGGGT